jgi:hypothetical protein
LDGVQPIEARRVAGDVEVEGGGLRVMRGVLAWVGGRGWSARSIQFTQHYDAATWLEVRCSYRPNTGCLLVKYCLMVKYYLLVKCCFLVQYCLLAQYCLLIKYYMIVKHC